MVMYGLPLPLNGNVYNLYNIVLLLTLSGNMNGNVYNWYSMSKATLMLFFIHCHCTQCQKKKKLLRLLDILPLPL